MSTSTSEGGGIGGFGGSTGGTGPVGCVDDSECMNDPNGPLCDPQKGSCVSCIPDDVPEVDCGVGLFCNPATGQCVVGCTGDGDCVDGLTCDLGQKTCV